MRLLPILLLAAPLAAQHAEFLAKARAQVTAEFANLPRFLCRQTVERWERPRGGTLRNTDTIRLQVLVTREGELHAPEGAEFRDVPIQKLLRSGMLSSGEYSAHLQTIVVSGAATLEWKAQEAIARRRVERFDFDLPPYLAKLYIGVPGAEAEIGQQGSVWFDSESHDLVEIAFKGTAIPPSTAIRSLETRIRYARVPAAGQTYLLPSESETLITHFDGIVRRNRIQFTHCRQFVGDTKLSFDEMK